MVVFLTVVDSKKKGKIESTCAEIENKLNPFGRQFILFAVDVAHMHLYRKSIMKDTESYYNSCNKVSLSFNQVFAITEIINATQTRNIKWNNNPSGNKINMRRVLSASHVGVRLLKATRTDYVCLFGNTCLP